MLWSQNEKKRKKNVKKLEKGKRRERERKREESLWGVAEIEKHN